MIKSLHITNYALIDEIEIDFSELLSTYSEARTRAPRPYARVH